MIGAGLFGATVATQAARAGHRVTIFDAAKAPMVGASGRSYYRLHRGYHYPRSPETGRESRNAEASFRKEYGPAVIDSGTQFYVIAPGSKVDGPGFALFMDRENLPYCSVLGHSLVNGDWVFEVEEPRIDVDALTKLVRLQLEHPAIELKLGTKLPKSGRKDFDAIVVCAYSGTNSVLETLGIEPETYKFQVVEKPLIKLDKSYRGLSVMVIDGPFCCLDPHGATDMHVLGHVTETIHSMNVGTTPEIPAHLKAWMTRGTVSKSAFSKYDQIKEAVARFIPGVRDADYVGSQLTVRAVLPNIEHTDARPTLVERKDEQVIRVFSGKLGTAVTAANHAVGLLTDMPMEKAA